jgi:hypothetical protein
VIFDVTNDNETVVRERIIPLKRFRHINSPVSVLPRINIQDSSLGLVTEEVVN